MSAIISAEVRLLLHRHPGGCLGLLGTLSYDPADPHAVALEFHGDDGCDVEWLFARDLLSDGLHAPAGLADVHVAPGSQPGLTDIVLSSPEGSAHFTTASWTIAAFLAQAYGAVPSGSEGEHELASFDGELELLLLDEESGF